MRNKLFRFTANTIVLAALALAAIGVTACKEPVDDPEPSNNAELSALSVSAGTLDPAFSAAVTAYSVSVANAVESITVTGTTADKGARLGDANGKARSLSVGANEIPVIVTAADGKTVKTYVVTVTRAKADASTDPTNPGDTADANATLASLTVSAGTLKPAFSPIVTDYSVDLPVDAAPLTVTGTPAGKGASVGGASGAATELKGGANAIAIVVTAADGKTKKTYTVTAYRAKAASDASNADLSDLGIKYVKLFPDFSPSVTEYTAVVGRDTPNATAIGTCANKDATLGGDNGIEKTLAFGENVFRVIVTAPDGTTKKTYTITVTRTNDTTAPKLIGFSLSPTEVDSSQGDAVVSGRVVAEDESGVRYVEVYFFNPENGAYAKLVKDEAMSTKTHSEYTWSVTVKKGYRGGEWRIGWIEVCDELFNKKNADLTGLTTKVIDKAPKGDQTPPNLIGFTLSPTEVDSTATDAVVGGRVVAEDESGVRYIEIYFYNPDNGAYAKLVKDDAKSTATHSEYTWTVTARTGSRGGEWRIGWIEVCDELFNKKFADVTGLTTKFIDKASPGDVNPPTLTSFTVSTDNINSANGNVTITGKIIAADDMSGVRFATLELQGPGGRRTATLTRVDPASSPRLYAEYDWSLTVEKGSVGGVWKIYDFEIVDEKFNRAYPVVANANALFTDTAPAVD